ncbi:MULTISPECIES: hypothetical protein [unclassified Brevundimonas]|uniref:hypothetical protein n=1 Tax=unclassified Brevundimonas TaxID=2622653 RepID=UPI0025BE37B1|nr:MULTISPECIES: hypothetical protein [unclassified Brevundimonas]
MAFIATAAAAVVTTINSAFVAAAGAMLPGLSFSTQLAVANFATKAVLYGAASLAGMAATNALMQPKTGAGGSPTDFKADPSAPISGVMGRFGVGGRQAHGNTWGKGNLFISFATVLSLGPIDSVQAFTANEQVVTFPGAQGLAANVEPYKDKMWMTYRLGLPSDAALGPPTGQGQGSPAMSEWTSTHRMAQFAHAFWTMRNNSKSAGYEGGVPKPQWTVRGMKVWDPRKDSTYPGGSGPQRRADWRTWEWSENPQLHALAWARGHHKLNTDGTIDLTKRLAGIGAPDEAIDTAAFVAGANIADANGWKIAGEWTTQDDKWQTLAAMLQAGGAVPVNRGAHISCLTNAPLASIYHLTNEDLAGPVNLSVMTTRRDRINTIVPRYRSEPHFWEQRAAGPVTSAIYRTEDRNEARTREVAYSFVAQAKQVAELAAYDVANARESLTGSMPCKPHLLGLRAGDAFTATVPEAGLNNQKFVVVKRVFDPSTCVVTLEVRSESDAKHAWALGQAANPAPSPSLTAVDPLPPAPVADEWSVEPMPPAAGGVQIPGLEIVGTPPDAVSEVLIEVSTTGTDPWNAIYKGTPPTGSIPAPGLLAGQSYYVRITYFNALGAASTPLVRGPFVAGDLVAGDTTHLKGEPVQNILDRLVGVEAISASNQTAVSDLEEVYGDTVAAAQSALAAGEAANLAVLKAGEAGSSANAANTSAGIATTKADEAGSSATAANASKVAAESARDSASGSASAAATSASTASTKATDAGNSATAASGSATTASTAAGDALTYSNQASSARDDAVAASVAAGASAATAQAEAATSIEQKNLATAAAAEAAVNANLAARTGGGAINVDPAFSNYPTDAQVPAAWWAWGSMRDQARRTDGRFSPYAFQQHDNVGGVREDCGIGQTIHNVAKGYYVIEADVRLLAGGWRGAGVLFSMGAWGDGTIVAYNFGTEPDTNNQVGNVGSIVRSFRRLVHIPDVANGVMTLHAMTSWQAGFGIVDPKIIVWDRCAIRPATEGEIAAGTVLPDVQAQLAITAAVAADSQSRLGSVSFDVTGGAGGAPFQIWGKAGPDGSMAGLVGTALILSNVLGTQVVEALKLVDGRAFFSAPVSIVQGGRRMTLGPGFGTTGDLLLWSGPASVPVGSESLDNGILGITEDDGFFGGRTLTGPFDSGDSGPLTPLTTAWTTLTSNARVQRGGWYLFWPTFYHQGSGTPDGEGYAEYGVQWRVVTTNPSGGDVEVLAQGTVGQGGFGSSWGPLIYEPPTAWNGLASTRHGNRLVRLQARRQSGDTASVSSYRLRGFYAV